MVFMKNRDKDSKDYNIMKKTLAALAVLGAFAGSAFAANVTLYGVIDQGFNWTQTKETNKVTTDKFQLKSGQNSGSRFGFKGTEDLGNGLVVGFNLENGFNADDGTFSTGGRLFHRESILFVRGGFGEVAFGRTGSLDAGTGSYNVIGTKATAFGLGWDTIGREDYIFSEGSRYDNTVTYKSPKFGGVTAYAQASLKIDNNGTDGTEGSSDANRYYAVGATGNFGALNTGLVVSTTDWSCADTAAEDDKIAVTGYVNYNLGMVKPMLAVQYFDEGKTGAQKGYAVVAGATAPLAGGTFKFTAGYRDAEAADDADIDYKKMMVGVGYEYPLSKRTKVYTGAGYREAKTEALTTTKKKETEVMAGLVHTF